MIANLPVNVYTKSNTKQDKDKSKTSEEFSFFAKNYLLVAGTLSRKPTLTFILVISHT